MKFLLALAVSFVGINKSQSCEKPVTFLNKGASAPCSGFLFTKEKEQEVRMLVEDYDLLQQELKLKNNKLDLVLKELSIVDGVLDKERQKTELWRTAAERSTLELSKINNTNNNRDLIMVLVGVLVTVGAGHALGQVGK